MKTSIIFGLFVLFLTISLNAFAQKPLSKCSSRPDFLVQHRSPISFKNLPAKIFIAQTADHFVENKSQSLQLWSQQSFIKGLNRFVCGQSEQPSGETFSIYAPTLMDLSGEQKLATSYWQFKMIANAKQFGTWNQKSRIFAKSKDFEFGMNSLGAQTQFFQISDQIFEMRLTRETVAFSETLSIRFDAVSGLQ